MKRTLRLYSLVLCLWIVISGCAKKTDTVVLKLGHGLDINHPVHKALMFMAEKLKEKSDGQVTLNIYPNEQLGSEREMIEQIQIGSIDMTKTSTSPLESFVPCMGVFSVPYVFRDSEHLWKVLDGPIGKKLLAAGEGVGFKGLCFYDAGNRSFYTKDKPILHPSDLQGMKIRVQQSATSMEMAEALGASPTPIEWGELYTSLQQGVVDGAENNPPSFETSRHYEVCKHYSLDEHTSVPDIVLISSLTWKKMPEDIRTMIIEAAVESAAFQKKLWAEKTAESLATVEAAGVTIYKPDKSPFMEKVEKMHESYKGTEIGDLLNQIKSVH